MKVTCISSFWNANFRFCVSAAVAIVFGLLSMVEKPAALQILVCAVRTVAVIFALSYVARTWFSLNQAFLGLWSGAAALCTRRYRMLKKIRQWIKIGIGVVKPLPAPVFYMVFCFANHRTQEELETCCIVAVIATVAWIFLEWETLIENYACSLRQEADDAEEKERPHHGVDGMVGEIGKILPDIVGIALQVSGNGRKNILKCPTGHHAIEAHDNETREDAHIADYLPRPTTIGARGILLSMAPHDKLAEHGRQSEHQHTAQIDQQEGCTAVHARLVWETPDIAQPNGRPRRGQHNSYLRCKCSSVLHILNQKLES